MERWNGGIVEWLGGRLTTLYCFAAVTVINTHAHFGATVTSLFVADIRIIPLASARYCNCKLEWPRSFQQSHFVGDR